MAKKVIGLVVVLGWSSVAWGQVPGQVVSYYAVASSGDTIVASVPAGGFVLTDVVVRTTSQHSFDLLEGSTVKFSAAISDGRALSYHLSSGIPFSEGSAITVLHTIATVQQITLSGYIPGPPSGVVPAIGAWGVAIMALMLLGAGTVVFRKAVAA